QRDGGTRAGNQDAEQVAESVRRLVAEARVEVVVRVVPARHPVGVPLFPYTTLFRSPAVHIASTRAAIRASRAAVSRSRPSCTAGDRKSTRLNSSHDQNSYAVFCLKKKMRPD